MGFLGDLGRSTNPVTWFVDPAGGGGSASASGDPSNTFIRRTSKRGNVADLINPIYGSGGQAAYKDYASVINQGYEGLGQPGQGPGRDEVARAATEGLASAFADRVFERTGSLPTEDQVRQYVSATLTPGFAQRFIQGLPADSLTAMADEYFQGNPDALTNPGTKSAEEQRILGLSQQLDKLYQTGRESLVKGYDEEIYGPGKQNTVNDLSAQGMLNNPNSRYALNALEANRGRDISRGMTTLEGQRAQGNIDLSKTIEGLLQQNKDRAQSAFQFGKTFGANRDDTAFNQGMKRKELDIAGQLGRAQANAGKRDWMDYANFGMNLLGTGAKAYAGFAG